MWVQTGVIVLGFGLALLQFRRWREEIAYDKKVDLAMKMTEVTYRLQQGFQSARRPPLYEKENAEWEHLSWEHLDYDGKLRAEYIFKPLSELRMLMWQASLIFSAKAIVNVEEIVKEFEGLCSTLQDAISDRDNHITEHREDMHNILGSEFSKNPGTFEQKINRAVTRMFEELKQLILEPKAETKYLPGEDWRTSF
jgi:hypothetical protein